MTTKFVEICFFISHVHALITIGLWYNLSRYMEFTMLKLFRFLIIMYGCVRRDLSVLSMSCNSNSIVH
jgi:hypothetical protein